MGRLYCTEETVAMVLHSDADPEPTGQESSSDTYEDDNDRADKDYIPGSSCTHSSESAESGEEETPDLSWTSKNGEIVWAPTNSAALTNNPPGTGLKPGPTRYAKARICEMVESFDLFFTTAITAQITKYTNLNGRRTVQKWKDIDDTTIRAYFGLLLLAGVYRSRDEATRSLWDGETGRNIFRATMSLKTFKMLSRVLWFSDPFSRPRRRDNDKLAAIREIWDMWTEQLPLVFNPGKEVCVDEQMLPFRGRCKFLQCMPKKVGSYGLKLWVTCDVQTTYTWKVSVYTGPSENAPVESQQGQSVGLDMTEGLEGINMTCNNFISSFGLATELLHRRITMVGTMERNRPELPPELLRLRGRKTLSSVFAFTETHTLVSYIPKRGKNVVLVSTKHRAGEISRGKKKKPKIILDYNRCKGGVDTMDEVSLHNPV